MKQKFLSLIAVTAFTVSLLSSCKKSDSNDQPAVTDAQIATQTDDQSMLTTEMDFAASDVNSVIESDATFSGNYSVLTNIVCDAAVTTNKDTDPMTITLTFSGETCSLEKKRTGVIVISMAKATSWNQAGAQVTVTYQNFKVIRSSDSKSVVLNGSHTYTNVSGKLLSDMPSAGTVVHTISSTNMSVTFDNGTARTWSVAKQHTFTYDGGLVLSVSGTHTEGDVTGIVEWGMNRFGNAFTTVITSPLVYKQACNNRLTAGVVSHTTADFTGTITFGLDATGTVTTCPGEGHYYYHLDWTRKNGKTFSIVLPY